MAHPQPTNMRWAKERVAKGKPHSAWGCMCHVSIYHAGQHRNVTWVPPPFGHKDSRVLGSIKEPTCIRHVTFPSSLPQLPHL